MWRWDWDTPIREVLVSSPASPRGYNIARYVKPGGRPETRGLEVLNVEDNTAPWKNVPVSFLHNNTVGQGMELVRRPVGQSKYGHYVDDCDNWAHETQGYH